MASTRSIFPLTAVASAALMLLGGCATREHTEPFTPPATPPTTPALVRPALPALTAARTNRVEEIALTGPMTVQDAVTRATACSPQIKALKAAASVAKQGKAAATDIRDPEFIGASGAGDDELGDSTTNPQANPHKWQAGGRFYFPNPFQMVPRVSARQGDLLAAQADLQQARWLVECVVRRLFAEISYLREDLALSEDLVRQNAQILKETRLRAEGGAATAVDVVSAAQRQLQSDNDLDLTRQSYRQAQRDLAALLDLPPGSFQLATNVAKPLLSSTALVDSASMEAAALRGRADLAALRWRTAAAKSAYREGYNARYPWLTEVKAWNRQPADDWWVGLYVSVPIFSWTKNHADNQLQEQWHLAEVNEANGVQKARREVQDAADVVRDRQQQQTRNLNEVGPLISEMRRTLQMLKNEPKLMPSQVAATEAQIIESLRLELATRWRYQQALLDLEHVVGQPLTAAVEPAGGKQ